jgi:hypothetical protein
MGGDAGGDMITGIHRIGKIRPHQGRVFSGGEWLQVQTAQAFQASGHADQAPAMGGQKVNLLRCAMLGGENEVSFILALLIVNQDNRLTGGDGLDNFRDGGNWDTHFRSIAKSLKILIQK